MQKSHWQWLLALGLGLVILFIVKLDMMSTTQSDSALLPSIIQPTEIGQDAVGANRSTTDSKTLADLPTVDQLQAMPTPAPDLLMVFADAQPTLNKPSAALGSVIQFSNESTKPVVLSFSSGARMTVGADGTAEYTLLRAGQETIEIETDTDLYFASVQVAEK